MTGNTLYQVDRGDGIFEVVIDEKKLSISQEEVIRVLGYPDGRIDGHFCQIIDDVLARVMEFCVIRAGYRVVEVHFPEGCRDGFTTDGRLFTTGEVVAAQLRKAQQAALFACTIGAEMEEWSRRAFRNGESVLGHFVDMVASLAVEKATGILHDYIGAIMEEQGLQITNRFSPGYCGWSVAEQQLLFSFFPKQFCGILLTESSLMVPIKSISGIIGIGEKVAREPYLCGRCGRSNCSYRAYKLAQSRKEKGS